MLKSPQVSCPRLTGSIPTYAFLFFCLPPYLIGENVFVFTKTLRLHTAQIMLQMCYKSKSIIMCLYAHMQT